MESTICYIYVLFLITWKSRVSLSIVQDPCPDITPSFQVTDMCQTGSATEQIGESQYGTKNYDHVTLRARTQEDNCTCLVFIENQSLDSFQMNFEPYGNLPNSAPKEPECGLELYLDVYQIEALQQSQIKDPIICTSGQSVRALSFKRNSVLRFTSKVINGNFTRGYCIDIQRVHVPGHNGTLKIVCDVPGRIPSMNITTTHPQDNPTGLPSSEPSSSTIKDESTLYIAVGGSAGGLLLVIVVLVIIFHRRKLSDKNIKKPETSKQGTTPTNEHDDPDYNGLKYNMLYVSADHQDVLEGDYHTVDNDQTPIHKKVSEHDINYSTVDQNVHKGLGYENFEGKEIAKREQNISPEENVNTYAVVNKRRVTGNSSNQKAALSPVYAVVDKTRKLKMENN